MKVPKLLARLMGRHATGIVPLLYTRALNRPLLVEPGMGETLIEGYLAAGDREGAPRESILQVAEGVAVIDVSGPLVRRDIIVPCAESPVSYEAITRALDAALEDSGVHTIVLRMDSPGGEVDGCFDLVDRIHEARGQKRLIAVADHMAYSAAYAIASACDEIWLSRTAGVGSIGVVTYHVDQSGFNEKMGIKVEFIHAGARKVDGNPHEPLTDEARAWIQAEIDRIYGLFVATVARNRGLSEEAVRDTEAGLYFADNAVSAGLADRLGTFEELLASLSAEAPEVSASGQGAGIKAETGTGEDAGAEEVTDDPAPQADPDDSEGSEPDPALDPAASVTANHLEILKACMDAGVPERAAHYIESGRKAEEVAAELSGFSQIRSLCAAAGMPDKADSFIEAKASPEKVRAELFDLLCAKDQDPDIEGHVTPKVSLPAKQPSAQDTYARRRQAVHK